MRLPSRRDSPPPVAEIAFCSSGEADEQNAISATWNEGAAIITRMPAASHTRRSFLRLAAPLAAAPLAATSLTALAGCAPGGSDSGSASTTGLASDTVQRPYPVHLTILADSALRWHTAAYDGYDDMLDYLGSAYAEHVLDTVSFSFEYADFNEIEKLSKEGFEDTGANAVIAHTGVIEAAGDADTLECGMGYSLVRDLSYHLSDKCVLARAAGSTAQLPDAATTDGDDSPNGSVNRMQELASFDGTVAVPDAATDVTGIYADQVLYDQGFYSSSTGRDGVFDESVADRLRMYETAKEATRSVVAGRCQLAFVLRAQIGTRLTGVEEAYAPPGGSDAFYSGAAVVGDSEAGVARDFFEFLANWFTG